MKILMINGSPHEHGCTGTALSEVERVLASHQLETERLWLGTQPMAGCIACRKCATTGQCIFDDAVNRVLDELDEYDALVIGSPVYYAGPAGQLCAFLDRLFFCAGGRMAGKFGAAVVSCRRGGASAAFERLNKYFTISHMPVVPSQYWNQVHGSVPADVMQDAEGLQTMRSLGENLAWLLRCREAGDRGGVSRPVYEPTIPTNFIR
ncbi:MAG: flavodoxin family protein [Clostridiales bacterium]|nr:flavodoxin family protein [Clostridiales bacterium]